MSLKIRPCTWTWSRGLLRSLLFQDPSMYADSNTNHLSGLMKPTYWNTIKVKCVTSYFFLKVQHVAANNLLPCKWIWSACWKITSYSPLTVVLPKHVGILSWDLTPHMTHRISVSYQKHQWNLFGHIIITKKAALCDLIIIPCCVYGIYGCLYIW